MSLAKIGAGKAILFLGHKGNYTYARTLNLYGIFEVKNALVIFVYYGMVYVIGSLVTFNETPQYKCLASVLYIS